jgi:hypothetical protein
MTLNNSMSITPITPTMPSETWVRHGSFLSENSAPLRVRSQCNSTRQPVYNPYAPYGEANATWTPPTFNSDGTIVKPTEPSTQDDRPSYETAPWANGASGGSQLAPPGTF